MKKKLLNYAKIALCAACTGLSMGIITATFSISFQFGILGVGIFLSYRFFEELATQIIKNYDK